MKKPDHGMTILEVVIAITILLMGVGFIAQSNAVTFKYRDESTKYKQMLFYAAGRMDAIIAKESVYESVYMPFSSYVVIPDNPDDPDNFVEPFEAIQVNGSNEYLEKVFVEVSFPGEEPVILYSYRLK